MTCLALDLDPAVAESCTTAKVLNASAQQTDRSLWFIYFDSKVGPAPDNCFDARPFERYKTVSGEIGTTYLCRARDEDDTITPGELAALRDTATRLNAANPATLEQHQAASGIKGMIASATRRVP